MAFIDGVNARTSRMQVEELKKQREAELFSKGYQYDESGKIQMRANGDAAVQEAQNQQTLQLAQSLQARLAAQDTDNAIADYVGTGDATYLQRALDNNPFLKSTWAGQGVQLVQNIDWINDSKLLAQVGVTPQMYDTPEKQKQMQRGLYKYYDGTEFHVGYVNNLVAQTGAMRRLSSDKANMIMEHIQGIANSAKGSSNAMEAQKLDISQQEADANTLNAKTNVYNANTNRMNVNNNHAEQMASLAVRREEAAVKLKTEGSTATQKDLMMADNLTGNLLQEFGASREDSSAFFNTDFSKRENYEKGYRYISKIEKLEGVQLSENDKTNISDMRQLIALADPASKLTGANTGIIDKKFGDVKAYLDDNVKGQEAKAAWTAFRNIMRRNLSGQALTDSEIKANTEAMGQLGEQLGPTLAKFKTSLVQVKSQVDSMNTVLNPYSVRIRLGTDQKKLDTIMSNIDTTLNYLSGAEGASAAKQDIGVGPKKSLGSIFGK